MKGDAVDTERQRRGDRCRRAAAATAAAKETLEKRGADDACTAASAAEDDQACSASNRGSSSCSNSYSSNCSSSSGDLFVVGMYQYDEATRSRRGGLSFYSVQQQQQSAAAAAAAATPSVSCILHHPTESFGCLDTRWLCAAEGCCCSSFSSSRILPHEFESLLAVIGSDCALHAFRVCGHPEEEEQANNSRTSSSSSSGGSSSSSSSLRCSAAARVPLLQAPGRDQIGLGLDALHGQPKFIAATCSDGSAAVVTDLEFLSLLWRAHDAEAWAVAVSPHSSSSLIATGADDCRLRLWDIRSCCRFAALETVISSSSSSSSRSSRSSSRRSSRGSSAERSPCLRAESSKSHSMGVTSLCFSPTNSQLLFSGSYDGFIRCFDLRQLKYPLSSSQASGGLWRLRLSPGAPSAGSGGPRGAPGAASGGPRGAPGAASGGPRGPPEPPKGRQQRPLLLAACCHGGYEVWEMEEAEDGAAPVLQQLLQQQPHESMAYGITQLCCLPQQEQQQQPQQQQQRFIGASPTGERELQQQLLQLLELLLQQQQQLAAPSLPPFRSGFSSSRTGRQRTQGRRSSSISAKKRRQELLLRLQQVCCSRSSKRNRQRIGQRQAIVRQRQQLRLIRTWPVNRTQAFFPCCSKGAPSSSRGPLHHCCCGYSRRGPAAVPYGHILWPASAACSSSNSSSSNSTIGSNGAVAG
ncbi:WD domain, G-beta repeat-containing protein, putative [Eimeria tenella]|uniref:methylated diphthine methylhydrolase n=1 Tax=Eimeria tenella TaxID=5802 RepID=U6KXF2_EIMTE|nr:WD domain, G-beta repeat-containing protein, putative [Eimeria tenella]CDJ41004.1 WD domain, G-beta repeat-containing protein, putative [Eimeria tenella]|eukprot:XP_013231754.1 WD domain, G-beta repeat-containing protein, putative [Eimeria tenella]